MSDFEETDELTVEENYRVVGRVKDAHGLKGELWIVLFAGTADWLDSMKDEGLFRLSKKESLAGLQESDLKDFPLKGARAHKNGVIVQSTALKDRTAAEAYKGHFLAIPEEFLVSEEGDNYFLSEIEGFRVLEDKREIGTITGFSHNGAQDLLIVTLVKDARDGVKSKDVCEIPFVEEFVVEVDDEKQVIHVELPEGLIEVQLGLDKKEASDETPEGEESEEEEAEEDDDIFGDQDDDGDDDGEEGETNETSRRLH